MFAFSLTKPHFQHDSALVNMTRYEDAFPPTPQSVEHDDL